MTDKLMDFIKPNGTKISINPDNEANIVMAAKLGWKPASQAETKPAPESPTKRVKSKQRANT